MNASLSRPVFLITESYDGEGRAFFRIVCHERFRKLNHCMPEAPFSPDLTSPHSRNIILYSKQCAYFNRSDNRHFSCFAYDFLYDECSHQ